MQAINLKCLVNINQKINHVKFFFGRKKKKNLFVF